MKKQKIQISVFSLVGILLLLSVGCSVNKQSHKPSTKPLLTPYQIIEKAPESDWRTIDNENTLYITLETGLVVVELSPLFAPIHVENTKNLIHEGFFDGTQFYRVIDGFVAQGGPLDTDKLKPSELPKKGRLTIEGEFTLQTQKPLAMTPLNANDDYADEVGYINGFAMARNHDKKQNWLVHCYGSFAMGRANEANSGGTELYIVIGQAQRYLDRNTTVFGRVIAGMEHIQALKRSTNLQGSADMSHQNTIINIRIGSDIKEEKRLGLQIMKTDSLSFKDLIESRKNRRGEWFLYQHDYIDVCSVAVPVRLQ
jgi:peptidylprolyl isomerase